MAITTKNIRIKMKNGKTRLQKVRVLASGKFKFMKNDNTVRGKTPKQRGKSAAKISKKRSSSKGGSTTTNNAKKKPTLPLGLLVPGLIGTWASLKDVWKQRKAGSTAMMRMAGFRFLGVNIEASTLEDFINITTVRQAYFPIGWAGGQLLHWGIGNKMKVNRVLGAANVPWVRV